jgi:hypothetical protein
MSVDCLDPRYRDCYGRPLITVQWLAILLRREGRQRYESALQQRREQLRLAYTRRVGVAP